MAKMTPREGASGGPLPCQRCGQPTEAEPVFVGIAFPDAAQQILRVPLCAAHAAACEQDVRALMERWAIRDAAV